jgi:hypothetical protein
MSDDDDDFKEHEEGDDLCFIATMNLKAFDTARGGFA